MTDQEQVQANQTQPGRSIARKIIPIIGFLIGLALIGWCLNLAFSPENRQQITRLSQISSTSLVLLLGLSAASLALNGIIFWLTLRPVRKLRVLDLVAVNGIASFLSYLPFKLSVITRFAIHNKRDGMTILSIGAWMLAFAGVLLTVALTMVIVGVAMNGINGTLGMILVLGLPMVACGLVVAMAKVFSSRAGFSRLCFVAKPIGFILKKDLSHTRILHEVHAGFVMLASPVPVLGCGVLRIIDLVIQALRMFVAASVMGYPLTLGMAMLAAPVHFLLAVLSPFGIMGMREAFTTLLADNTGLLLNDPESSQTFAGVVLMVTAVEIIVNIAAAGLGFLILRPDRLLKKTPK